MIQVLSTLNEAGVSVLGEEGLDEALHEVVGDEEGELERYASARLQ